MAKNKPTKDEHFIPQCYLKQFSSDGVHLNQYDVLSHFQTPVPVSTKSICYKKNMYEFRDENGKIIYSNMIEKLLGIIEGIFADTMRSINRKVFDNKENLKTSCFLTEEEKSNLAIYIAIQQLRLPWFIDELETEIKNKYEDIFEETTVRNLAIIASLPIYKTLNNDDKNILLHYFDQLSNMAYYIGVSDDENIITSDNPATLLYDDNHDKLVEVILPLSSKIVLFMKPLSQTKLGFRNQLIRLTKENIEYTNKITMKLCKRWIYSNQPLSQEQIDWIIKDRS